MTISPPAKVPPCSRHLPRVLASGVDSLVLAIDVTWADETLFDYLHAMKELAQQSENEVAVALGSRTGDGERLLFSLKPYGSKGYEWVLQGGDYTVTIGNWLEPKSRPSIMAEIRSEALWSLGPIAAVERLAHLLELSGGNIYTVKPSRVDLCVDLLLPEQEWSLGLLAYKVTRAAHCAPHFHHRHLTGISVGKGKIAGRLYDKPLEIRQKSKKIWMFDIWGLKDVPFGQRVIRIEGQFRREAIKELGIDLVTELFGHLDNMWAFFSQGWLKFMDNPGRHYRFRRTLPFWAVVQNGFLGVQNPRPLIRCQSIQTKKKQLAAQTYGTLNSFIAIEQEEFDAPLGQETSLPHSLESLGKYLEQSGINEFALNIHVLAKRSKYQKAKDNILDVHRQRIESGFPSNLTVNSGEKENKK